MDKKDIYEHLAKIYLDASLKRKKRTKEYWKVLRGIFFIVILFIFGLNILLFTIPRIKNKPSKSEIALVLQSDVAKINFNFNPAKKESYSIGLQGLDLTKFKTLGFALRKTDYKDIISLKIEFTSRFKEKSEVYLKDIPHKWQDYKIELSDFKNISDWSNMLTLSFIVEEWNVKEKQDVVYIDNVRFIR